MGHIASIVIIHIFIRRHGPNEGSDEKTSEWHDSDESKTCLAHCTQDKASQDTWQFFCERQGEGNVGFCKRKAKSRGSCFEDQRESEGSRNKRKREGYSGCFEKK